MPHPLALWLWFWGVRNIRLTLWDGSRVEIGAGGEVVPFPKRVPSDG